jgi:hypothetical protein
MRRFPLLALLPLALAACSSGSSEPIEAVPDSAVYTALSLDLSAARQTVIDFLNGYAAASQDRGVSLERTIGSRSLQHWAHWVTVQFEELEGEVTGDVEIREVKPVDQAVLGDLPALEVSVDATVSLALELPDGQVDRESHEFVGIATLLQRDTGYWVLLDITRDGRSLADSIALQQETREVDGIRVELASVFAFSTVIMANLVVHNGSDGPIRINLKSSAMRVGTVDVSPRAITPTLSGKLAPGETAEGSIFFQTADLPPPNAEDAVTVLVGLRRGPGKPTVLEFLLQVQQAGPSPSPAPSASP